MNRYDDFKESVDDLNYILRNPEGSDKQILKDILGTIKDIQFTNAMKIIQKYELPINPIYLSENEEETNVELNKFKNKLYNL